MESSHWAVLCWRWEAAQNSGQLGGPRMGEKQCHSRGHLVMSGDSFGFHHWRERCATGISWLETRQYFIMPRTALRMSVVLRPRNPIGGHGIPWHEHLGSNPDCAILDEVLNPSGTQFSHLSSGDKDSSSLRGLL